MKFGTATIVAVIGAAAVASFGGEVAAFNPAATPKGFSTTAGGLMVPSSSSSKPITTTNMDMVAGGAERAAGQEYYEGKCRRGV